MADAKVSAVWYTEDPYQEPVNHVTSQLFDVVFSNDSVSAASYGGRGVHLPLAAANRPEVALWPERRFDLSFVASAWPNRLAMIAELVALRLPLRTKLHLVTNRSTEQLVTSQMREFASSDSYDFGEYQRITGQSKLSLFIDRDFSIAGAQRSVSDTPGPRLFEAMAAGCCVLSDNATSGDLSKLGLMDGVHYFGFDDLSGLVALLEAYRSDPGRFETVATRGRAIVSEVHMFDRRLASVLERCAEVPIKIVPASAHEPAVLFVTHNLAQFGLSGGSELYLARLAELDFLPNHFVLSRDRRDGYGKRYVLYDASGQLADSWVMNQPLQETDIASEEFTERLAQLIVRRGIGAVFFNHLLGVPPTVWAMLKRMGVSYHIVLHDYFLGCDSVNLIDKDWRYCGVDSFSFEYCNACTAGRRGAVAGSQAARRGVMAAFLTNAASVITNTPGVAARISAMLEVRLPAVVVIPPPSGLRLSPESTTRGPPGARLRVAVVGNLHRQKGSIDFAAIASRLSGDAVDLVQFGDFDANVAGVETLPSVTLNGAYSPDDPAVMEQLRTCDCALFLSRWPETYCMSLTETLAAGLVPIAYAVGAFEERIAPDFGYLLRLGDVDGVVALLRSLAADGTPLAEKKSHLPEIDDNRRFYDGYRHFFANLSLDPVARWADNDFGTKMLLRGLPAKWILNEKVPSRSGRRINLNLFRRGFRYVRHYGVLATVRQTIYWLRS